MFAIASFEFRSRLRLASTWVYFLVFLALTMLWMAAAGGMFQSANVVFGSGKVFVNSPFALAQTTSVLGLLGVTVMAAVMGRAVQQDFEHRTHNFFFTSPIHKLQYLGGRFVGALGVVLVIFSGIAIGAWLSTHLPGMDPERLGPNRWSAYLGPYAAVLVPNAVLMGAVFFSLAMTTRKMLPVYIGSVLVIVGWLIAQQLVRDLDNKAIAALVDPFGTRAMSQVAEYWTIAERNTRAFALEGMLLWNRLLWLGVALAITALAWWRFSFAAFASDRPAKASKKMTESNGQADTAHAAPPIATRIEPAGLRALPGLVALNLRETIKNVYFAVLVFAGIAFMLFASTTLGDIFGTSTWPHTFQMVDLLGGSFNLFMIVIVTFYAGELAWREREARLDQITDALPVPTWLPFIAKLLALMAVPLLLQAVLMLCGMAIQLAQGFTRFDIPVYLQALFGMQLVSYWFLCALAFTVHSLVNHKYLGHFIMVAYYLAMAFSSVMGVEHNLLKFGSVPMAMYSDMNGWGHALPRIRAFQGFWAAASVLLLVAAYLFWTRGTVAGWAERRRMAAARLGSPTLATAAVAFAAFAGLGGWIYYNTNVLNTYTTAHDAQRRQADYEKTYKPLMHGAPQPKITGVVLDVAMYPQQQGLRARGTMSLENKTTSPVEVLDLHFLEADRLVVHKLSLGVPARPIGDDRRIGVRRLKFDQPLAPGAKTTLAFDLELVTRGFTNDGQNNAIVRNGSFANAMVLMPLVGYQERAELERDQDRKKFGLAPKERMRDRDDAKGLQQNGIAPDSDWIAFEVTVSTEADQIAIAPGYLQREWTAGGRRYFHYKMDAPILNFYAFQSARYAVKRDRWNNVAIEIYHHPGHEYNLASMIDATKAALDYNGRHFGPYQYRQFRIIEFPRYETFAQAFPNTIPYSEQIGFIARVRPDDEEDIDYPYYVTAHEAAHQWWGHQVVGGNVQGETMLIETLAQYSSLMVMKHRVGPAKMRKFMRYELDRYLLGRGLEQKKELPLARVENQPYIHYSKGSLVMYALADYIGEDRLNQAIRRFRDEHAFKGPPYPNTTQFIARLREVTPPELQYLIDDLFERIVVHDNRAVSASAKPLPDKRYEVTIKVAARKLVADALGKETEVPVADLVDIGVLDDKGEPLWLEKRKLAQAESSFTVVVDRKPATAGIDPLNKLIDRRPKDNTVPVAVN